MRCTHFMHGRSRMTVDAAIVTPEAGEDDDACGGCGWPYFSRWGNVTWWYGYGHGGGTVLRWLGGNVRDGE